MQISKEVHELILDNIEKDVLSLRFLQDLRECLVKYNNLNPFLNDINLDLTTIGKRGLYSNKIISLNKDTIIETANRYLSIQNAENNIIAKNIVFLHTVLHEIVHANQSAMLNKEIIEIKDNVYLEAMIDSSSVRQGYRYNRFFNKSYYSEMKYRMGQKLYSIYHDIFPDEVNANCVSAFYLCKLLREINDIDMDSLILPYLVNELTKGYIVETKIITNPDFPKETLTDYKITCPTSRFYKKTNLRHNEKKSALYDMDLKQKYELGLTNNKYDICEVFKENVFFKECSDEEIMNCFKQSADYNEMLEKIRLVRSK